MNWHAYTLPALSAEANIQVLNVSFSTLAIIGDVLGTASREDIRAVSIALYAGRWIDHLS
jgi:hypothetical protein